MKTHQKSKTASRKKPLTALVANKKGDIFELEGYAAVGMAGSSTKVLTEDQTISMPHGSELMYLPDRKPILYNLNTDRIEIINENPYQQGEPILPVAVFNSPGYVLSYVSAFREKKTAGYLPLFSYGAVGWKANRFRSAAVLVDREKRQDLRLMKADKVLAGVREMQKRLPQNRLRRHLETCALTYGCPAGKNFFLGRYEAPLPTAGRCNARCLGCLSHQETNNIPISQNRIAFTPTPEEIAEVSLAHIHRVKRAIVSFGQGCEGDPLLVADVIEPAICKIRIKTDRGTIHMNTNGSRPDRIKRLLRSGLDSIRISLNSVREKCYVAYFRPMGYGFADVEKSIDHALCEGKFVSINYLNCPGFTDTHEEFEALVRFLKKHPIHMIQWRNLNFDPVKYWRRMEKVSSGATPMGMTTLLKQVRNTFPHIRFGYFNPPKETFPSNV